MSNTVGSTTLYEDKKYYVIDCAIFLRCVSPKNKVRSQVRTWKRTLCGRLAVPILDYSKNFQYHILKAFDNIIYHNQSQKQRRKRIMFDDSRSLPKKIIEHMRRDENFRKSMQKMAREYGFEGDPERFIAEQFIEVRKELLDFADKLLSKLPEGVDLKSSGKTDKELSSLKIVLQYLKSKEAEI